jgi:hypothetical protein
MRKIYGEGPMRRLGIDCASIVKLRRNIGDVDTYLEGAATWLPLYVYGVVDIQATRWVDAEDHFVYVATTFDRNRRGVNQLAKRLVPFEQSMVVRHDESIGDRTP